MKNNPDVKINKEMLKDMSLYADMLIIKNDRMALKKYIDDLVNKEITFDDKADEVQFLYTIGNCYQALYHIRDMDWFSDELSKAAIFFRRSLDVANKILTPSRDVRYLISCIETNLANSLKDQGRLFCCIPYLNSAIKQHNPIAMISIAQNELHLASALYDPSHEEYHLFIAYKHIVQGLKYKEFLFEEQQEAFHEDGSLMRFKRWFEENFNQSSFEIYENEKYDYESRKQKEYLSWCAKHTLFINDLNDVLNSEIVYQDIITLPNLRYNLNQSLSMHESLMYHGNFDELKNEYCYARYLFHTAVSIPFDTKHFFNDTYPHVNDMSHSITNLKSSHYKTAFRVLYSLFDKIAYLLHRFLKLNDIKDDSKISFDAIFRDITKRNKWVPHPLLKESSNPFIHALFYILKDIRDVKDATPTTRWLDPDAKLFTEIRNAIEHRSLKIVDDFGYTLTKSDSELRNVYLDNYRSEKEQYEIELIQVHREIKNTKDSTQLEKLNELKSSLQLKKDKLDELIDEQVRMSSHSMLITVSEIESRTFTLMKLARNSIIYLSLALHVEEKNRPEPDGFIMPMDVPLK